MTENAATTGSDGGSQRVVWFLALVNFVNVLDFILVMPLGPDFTKALDIPTSKLGVVGAAYAGSAALAGLLSSRFLDRFDRRTALTVSLAGLGLSTLACGLAVGLKSMVAARVLAGAFGGPATSISYAIVADVVPADRRGRATSVLMGAFSIASIAGLPAALELSSRWTFRIPFIVVGLGAWVLGVLALRMLPRLRAHLDVVPLSARSLARRVPLFKRPVVWLAYAVVAVQLASVFLVVPNMPVFILRNLAFPRAHFGLLYFVGGLASLLALRFAGRIVDRTSATLVSGAGAVVVAATCALLFVADPVVVPIPLLFVGWMFGAASRNVSMGALVTRVPHPRERARFMSIESAVRHLASSVAALAGTGMLMEQDDGTLVGMHFVATIAIALTLITPLLLVLVERRVRHVDVNSGSSPEHRNA